DALQTYIINIFLFLRPADHKAFLTASRLVKYVLHAEKFLCILSLGQFDFSRNLSITFRWGKSGSH
uniref:Uncharacterized protein n=1 Tax=Monopterus albus TaxID=43700 RepID=A0A3Q3JWB8_MONAL